MLLLLLFVLGRLYLNCTCNLHVIQKTPPPRQLLVNSECGFRMGSRKELVMACIYRRGTRFWISYYVGAKQIKKSLGTDNERVARSKLKRLEYELALGDLHVASKLPLPVILEAFCKELRASRTYKSYKNDFSRLRIFFGPVCDLLRPGVPGKAKGKKARRVGADKYAGRHVKAELLEDITAQVINRFLTARIQDDGWSPKTVNLMRQTLHKLFSYAIKHHDFKSRDRRYPNPAAGVERKSEPARQIRFLQLDDITAQFEAVRDYSVIHAMVAVYIYAGLRREEATWLTDDDMDLNRRLIRVQAKTVGDEFWQPKTKRNRIVPISRNLFAILSSYTRPCHSVWFFPSPTGKRWDPDNFSQDLRRINNAAGLKWSCLDFRHTFGSQLAQKGESLQKIAELMGNSPEICRKHYAALIPERMHDTVEFADGPTVPTAGTERVEAMFQEILGKLHGTEPEKRPDLRLVHYGRQRARNSPGRA